MGRLQLGADSSAIFFVVASKDQENEGKHEKRIMNFVEEMASSTRCFPADSIPSFYQVN